MDGVVGVKDGSTVLQNLLQKEVRDEVGYRDSPHRKKNMITYVKEILNRVMV